MKKQSNDITLLSLVRGWAILMIVGYHWYTLFWPTPFFVNLTHLKQTFFTNLPFSLIGMLFLNGYQGVHLFLFLSGFLLTYRYFDKKSGWLRFLAKRLLKILVPFYPACLLAIAATIWLQKQTLGPKAVLSTLFFPFSLDIFANFSSLINPTFWFLGLIVQFYLVFPILLKLLKRLGSVGFFILITFCTLACRFLAIYFFYSHPIGTLFTTVNGGSGFIILPTRLFELALGMIAGYWYTTKAFPKTNISSQIALLLVGLTSWLCGNLATLLKAGWLFSDWLIVLGLILTITPLLSWLAKIAKIKKVFLWLADYSYEMYLLHYPLIFGVFGLIVSKLSKIYSFILFTIPAFFALLLASWGLNQLAKNMTRLLFLRKKP